VAVCHRVAIFAAGVKPRDDLCVKWNPAHHVQFADVIASHVLLCKITTFYKLGVTILCSNFNIDSLCK